MAIFVGSDNNDSKIRDNRVGLAISTSNPSSPDTGDAYYNSTDNKLTVYNGSDWASAGGGGTIDMVASGAIANGDTCIVNTNGTVSKIVSTHNEVNSPTVATFNQFNSGDTEMIDSVYDPDEQKIIVVYRDDGNNSYGTCVVGDIDSATGGITWGTPVVFHSQSTASVRCTYEEDVDRLLVVFRDAPDLKAVAASISGTVPTFGSVTTIQTSGINNNTHDIVYDKNNQRSVVVYEDGGASDGPSARTLQVTSGVTVGNIGSKTTIQSITGRGEPMRIAYDDNAQKCVVVYGQAGENAVCRVVTLTSSGSNITVGTVATVASYVTAQYNIVYDESAQKHVIIYTAQGDSTKGGRVRVATVSGSTISLGQEDTWLSSDDNAAFSHSSMVYIPELQKCVAAFRNLKNSNHGNYIKFTVNTGTNRVTTSSIFEFIQSTIEFTAAVYNRNSKVLTIPFRNVDAAGIGSAANIALTTESTNLTANNFIGFSDAAYTDGQTAKIQIEGSVDDAQTGLTTAKVHYVQTDGSLSTTAGNPSVSAGIAITDTKIIVKG